MIQYKKILMTLALLLTAVTGAWAQDGVIIKELTVPAAWENDNSPVTVADLPGFKASTYDEAKAWTDVPQEGRVYLFYAFDGDKVHYADFEYGSPLNEKNTFTKSGIFSRKSEDHFKFYYTAEPTIDVTPGSSANTWTFQMPGSDVVLTPLYAPAAKWDVENAGTAEEKVLLPAALEGIIAGQDEAIVTAGQSAQGTVMYAVTTTADAAPALTAFSAAVPTAKDVADDGATLYVWYYIQGQDTPDGQQATEENTFNDSEISPEPLTVQVLTNKFDIQFTAANDNTIQAGKATVTVGGTPATLTDGKLQGVKMGSEVKMTAQPGYKFRKVEVKKGGAALLTLSVCGETIYYAEGETWAEAIQNHPTENQGWGISDGDVNHDNLGFLMQNGNFVPGTAKIDPNASYDNSGV